MFKLKLQYFGHLMWRTDSLEKMLGKFEGRERRGWQRMRWLDSITNSMDMNFRKLQKIVNSWAWCAAGHMITKSETQLSIWTTPRRTTSTSLLEGNQLPISFHLFVLTHSRFGNPIQWHRELIRLAILPMVPQNKVGKTRTMQGRYNVMQNMEGQHTMEIQWLVNVSDSGNILFLGGVGVIMFSVFKPGY